MDVYAELRDADDEDTYFDEETDLAEEDEGGMAAQIPTGPAYARELSFWRHILVCLALGAFMGAVAYVYLETIERVQTAVFGEDVLRPSLGAEGKKIIALGHGEWIWVVFTAGAGLVVGLVKLALRFPRNVRGFLAEVRAQHVNPVDAPKIVLVSLLSLCGGVSLGPEAAMGSLGGGLAQAWSAFRGLDKEATQQNVVNAMAGAMGGIFPSPVIAVTTMTEIGRVETMHHNYMRAVAMMTVAASTSFGVFFAIKGGSYLPLNPLTLTYQFHSGDQIKGLAIGLLSGLLGLCHIIIAGICKRIFVVFEARILRGRSQLATVASPLLGGLVTGCILVWSPLCVGSGSLQTASIVRLAAAREIDSSTLFASAFAKSLAFGIAKASGFVGGAIFPLIFVGSATGIGFARLINDHEKLPLVLADACFTAAVPSAVAPMPVSFLLMIAFTFNLGASQATPIFVACIASHLVTCGFGLVLSLLGVTARSRR
ncbi:Hypothetical Protein FCC1311_028662 [Hondaea fermentalgiana]|uniref:Chloride channel protein n=1 Tax=Hondaea fermentalgiana TaxID=2315210 RepID=A0A2R5G7X4_9STRA|nr:Hypothetical Protein FCC1311_028662 [Hondaea fermentalgiana]|eukprot:GBG26645.1 Hypothetical Protein FCC1311_028662 [Hondaea fermentalgiana]